jgi:hypothetical protein
MSTFPILKTSAVAQYPAQKRIEYQNESLRFVDGTEQRYRDCARPLRVWTIRLDELDEAEAAAMNEFFAGNQGAFGNFAFTDPWDAQVYPNCSLDTDGMDLTGAAEMSWRTVLTVRENRG